MKGSGGCRPGTRALLVPYLTHTLPTLRIDHSIAGVPTQSVGSVNPRSTFTPTHNLSIEGCPFSQVAGPCFFLIKRLKHHGGLEDGQRRLFSTVLSAGSLIHYSGQTITWPGLRHSRIHEYSRRALLPCLYITAEAEDVRLALRYMYGRVRRCARAVVFPVP